MTCWRYYSGGEEAVVSGADAHARAVPASRRTSTSRKIEQRVDDGGQQHRSSDEEVDPSEQEKILSSHSYTDEEVVRQPSMMLFSGTWPLCQRDENGESCSSSSGIHGFDYQPVPEVEESLELSVAWDDPPSSVNSSSVGDSTEDDEEEEFEEVSTVDDIKISLLENVPPLAVTAERHQDVQGSKVKEEAKQQCPHESFTSLRVTYLLVTLVIMLADGLQGTL